MRKCQLIHAMTAPLSRSTKSRGGKGRKPINRFSIMRLIAEALRRPEFAPHVAKPKKPEILSGCDPSEILPRIREAIANRPVPASGKRRKFRPDKHLAIAIVISYPTEKSVIEADPAERVKFREWRTLRTSIRTRSGGQGDVSPCRPSSTRMRTTIISISL